MGESATADAILLEGIQVPAALGVTAAERSMRRPVMLDLEVGFDLRAAGRTDRIRDTVHYAHIYRVVEDVASNQEHKLVEALGARIADAVPPVAPRFGIAERSLQVVPEEHDPPRILTDHQRVLSRRFHDTGVEGARPVE